MIREAAEFAERAHEGVYRKGTKIPYITHPMETAAIVTAFTLSLIHISEPTRH